MDISTPSTRPVPVDKITPSPFQVRQKFDEAAIKELAETLREHGLQNAINVRPVGDRFELIAGERRWRAAKLLGWQTIEAKVEPVDDKEAALRGMVENIQREDLSAIEQAQGYKRLSEAPFGLNQSKIARMVGKEQSLVNKYFAVSKLCEHPGGMNRFIPLTLRHLLELCRLPKPEDQASLAEETAKKGLSVAQLKALVDQKPGPAKTPSRQRPHRPKGAAGSPEPDPLADFWPQVQSGPAMIALRGQWGVSYGRQAIGPVIKGKPVSMPAWSFWMISNTPTPKAALKKWFQAMADAMGNTGEEERQAQKVMEALVPSNEQEMEQALEEQKKVRLPANAKEWAEVEAVAAQGPGAVYAWTHGENSLMARKARSLTWADLGEKDAIAGSHALIEALEQMVEGNKA